MIIAVRVCRQEQGGEARVKAEGAQCTSLEEVPLRAPSIAWAAAEHMGVSPMGTICNTMGGKSTPPAPLAASVNAQVQSVQQEPLAAQAAAVAAAQQVRQHQQRQLSGSASFNKRTASGSVSLRTRRRNVDGHRAIDEGPQPKRACHGCRCLGEASRLPWAW